MPPSIIMRLHEKLARIQRDYQPTAVYLGTQENYDLMEFLGEEHHWKPYQGEQTRPQWNGLQVYTVNSESHIAFA